MLNFENDYSQGAHEKVLKRLVETNMETLAGYGTDIYCESARAKIKKACGCSTADIYFLTGGTQTNQAVIGSLLNRHEGVIAAASGHINTHEAGAVEFTGHKVLALPHKNGRLPADTLSRYLEAFYADENHGHMVFPGMVYISHPTEYGTLYSRRELEALSAVCRQYKIPLYLDGARLGYALACGDTDVALPDLAELCSVFYIGGTKIGALCGEAVVFPKNNAPRQFTAVIKQHGALLAKGRLLGIQFDALFTDDLYLKIGRHAVAMAQLLQQAFEKNGYQLYLKSPTNQIFVVLTDRQLQLLRTKAAFSFWERLDGNRTVVRFAASWATEEKSVQELISILEQAGRDAEQD